MARSRSRSRPTKGGGTRRVLLVVLLSTSFLGAAAVGLPTGAFTTVGADRGVDVSVADAGGKGLIGVEILDADVEWQQPDDAVRITNNAGQRLTVVSGSISTTSDQGRLSDPAFQFSLDPGESRTIQLECSKPGGPPRTRSASVTATIAEASSQTLDVSDVTVTGTIEFECNPGKGRGGDGGDDGDDRKDDDRDDDDDRGDDDTDREDGEDRDDDDDRGGDDTDREDGHRDED